MWMRRDDGQSSVEWVGLVAAISTLVFAGSAIAQAPFVGRTVSRQLARAICIVSSGDCERDREPCTTEAESHSSMTTIKLLVAELGRGKLALIEHRSDGTILITRVDRDKVATKLGLGVGGSVSVGRHTIGLEAAVDWSIAAAEAGGRSWVARSQAEAGEMLARLIKGDDLPPEDVSYSKLGMESALRAAISVGRGAKMDAKKPDLQVIGESGKQREVARRIDRRTGAETLYFTSEADRLIRVLALGKQRYSTSDKSDSPETYAIELDGMGRPRDLKVITVGDELPEIALSFGGMLKVPGTKGRKRRYETTGHLDLTDPAHHAAALALVRELRDVNPKRLAATVGRVLRLIEERGTVEVRALDISGGDDSTLAASGRVGPVQLAGSHVWAKEATTLVAAGSRGLDGQWVPRDDCVSRG
jgi:hypothetical protein